MNKPSFCDNFTEKSRKHCDCLRLAISVLFIILYSCGYNELLAV